MNAGRSPARRSSAGRCLLFAARVLAAGALAACSSRSSPREGHGADVAGAGGSRAAHPAGPGGTASVEVREQVQSAELNKKRRKSPPEAPSRAVEDAGPPVDLVTIHVLVEPPQKGHVIWGAKDFGLGPLDIRRPRGSGPLDLLVRAPGYLTLHTRAFTDRNNTLSVRLVPEAEATRFPGYRASAATGTAHASSSPASRGATAHAPRLGKPASVPARRSDVASDGAGAP